MGKITGFMEYKREENKAISPKERIQNYKEFHTRLSKEERSFQAARCMECGVPFCQSGMTIHGMTSGCPLHNMIPEWNDLLYRGNLEQALDRLLKTNNFPEFTSRVCPAPCEAACTCGLNGSPVTIKANEMEIIESGYEQNLIEAKPPKVRTGKRVAIIGSGPSGLAAADQLNKRGHSVTIFERENRPGGLLMYGIPNMKLEKTVIERRIKLLEEEGIEFRTGVNVGVDVTAEEIKSSYDAVILSCGASNPRNITVAGRESKGIYFAVDYLKSATKKLIFKEEDQPFINASGKHVLIIGGGDTGNDCVGTAIRQGAKSVIQLEMMPQPPKKRQENNPWPEWPRVLKTDYGQEEAIAQFGCDPRIYETTVKEFKANDGGEVNKVVTVMVKQMYHKELNRFVMEEIEGTEKELEVDLVFIAAGFLGAESYVAEAFGVDLDHRTNVSTASEDYVTSQEKVFAAGDMRRGQSLVVWAIKEGRSVAVKVDEFLNGYSNLA